MLIWRRLEAFARICVSGFLLDPEMPTSALFSPTTATSTTASLASDPSSSVSRQPSLVRKMTFRQRLRQMQRNIAQPFRLANSTTASTYGSSHHNINDTLQNGNGASRTPVALEKAQQKMSHLRDPSRPNFFSKALRSDNPDALTLPFRLNVASRHDKVHRNIPYLRQSWSRIDFVAITSFWVSFVLSMTGVERGTYHIGLFRALSVLRTARLLAISSGTTVSASKAHQYISNCEGLIDNHAFSKNRPPAAHECRIFCAIRDGFILVREIHMHSSHLI